MNSRKWYLASSVAALAIAAVAVAVTVETKTFRTTASLVGLTQVTDPVTQLPEFNFQGINGRRLVNLARARSIGDTNNLNEVLAMTFACDLSSASLVVYDRTTSNIVLTIAQTTMMDVVREQRRVEAAGPNKARFVAQFQIASNGDETNGLLDGYLTASGRLHLNPETGCPKPVLVTLDKEGEDKKTGDRDVKKNEDPEEPVEKVWRTGRAHVIGTIDLVSGASTSTVLIPNGYLSMRRELPVPTE
jgi:hypothetical protein